MGINYDNNICACTNCSCNYHVSYLSMTNNILCLVCGRGKCNQRRTNYLK